MAPNLTPPSSSSKRLPQLPPPAYGQPSSLPAVPRAVSRFHTDCAGSPRHPTSAGSSHTCPPLSLHCWSRVQISEASTHARLPEEARRFNQDDHVTLSSLRKVWTGPPSSPMMVLSAGGPTWSPWRIVVSPPPWIGVDLAWTSCTCSIVPLSQHSLRSAECRFVGVGGASYTERQNRETHVLHCRFKPQTKMANVS